MPCVYLLAFSVCCSPFTPLKRPSKTCGLPTISTLYDYTYTLTISQKATECRPSCRLLGGECIMRNCGFACSQLLTNLTSLQILASTAIQVLTGHSQVDNSDYIHHNNPRSLIQILWRHPSRLLQELHTRGSYSSCHNEQRQTTI